MQTPRNKSLFLQISISKGFRGVFILRKHRKNQKIVQCILTVILITGLAAGLVFLEKRNQSPAGQNQRFEEFTEQIFCDELSSNTISLHYTLRDPKAYGIKKSEVTFGKFTTDGKETMEAVENLRKMLKTFDYEKFTVQNRLTYDILEYHLEQTEENVKYLVYEEPLGLVSGIQTQLPVLLSEYPLTCKKDVDTYLELMQTTPEYFDSLITFEKEKAKEGLFMPDAAADQVMEQCTAFMEMGESNYLISTFVERIKQVKELDEHEKSDYIQKNALALNSYILPAYSKLKAEIQNLKGSGNNAQGLCYFPNGTAYYEQVVKNATGSKRTVPEMEKLTRQQIVADLEAMEDVLGIRRGEGTKETFAAIQEIQEQTSVQVSAGGKANPVSILKQLEKGIQKCFPEPPKTNVDVKYVPEAMEKHLSPAFYMIPAMDDYKENVIYVNQAHMGNPLTLYTTLAHEGYPGHLYQTIYYAGTDPMPIRNILNFGGYVEGWATYAEMCSYSLAPISKEQAILLQKNSSILLGLYTLADIGIHYHGWSRDDLQAFFTNYGIKDRTVTDQIYDLILGAPGNYLKYYIGYVEFLELKKLWIQEKGAHSPQKAFHEAVLKVGPAPFAFVEKYMWKMGEEIE